MSGLISSFGPFGKAKLFKNNVGSRVATSDGQQLYKLMQFSVTAEPICQHLLDQCVKCISERGNGVLTAIMVFQLVFSKISGALRSNSNHRSAGIRSIDAIIRTVLDTNIRDYFLATGVWRRENSVDRWVHDCCSSLLVPACDWQTSQALIAILTRFLIHPNSSYIEVTALCRHTLSNSDILLFSTLDGASVSGGDNSSTVTPHFIPANEMILLGNCYDLAALVGSFQSSNATTETSFKFVCIRHLVEEEDRPVILSTSFTSLSVNASLSNSISGSVLSSVLSCLAHLKVIVVLTEDSVDEASFHHFSSKGVILIDRVPVAYLEYLTQRSQTRLFFNTSDFVDHCMGNTNDDVTSVFAYFAGLKRLKFIDGNYQQSERRASFLHITGLRYGFSGKIVVDRRTAATSNTTADTMDDVSSEEGRVAVLGQQVVLRCLNLTQCGTCNRLIKRCLRMLSHGNVEDGDDAARRWAPIVVPGGGATEMHWSRLWSQVADALDSISDVSHRSTTNEELPLLLANRIVSHFSDIISPDVRRRVLAQSVFLCRTLAEAYLAVPRQLLLSCVDLMDLPAECRSSSGGGSSNNNDGKVKSGGRAQSKFERMWSFWMSAVMSSKEPLGVIAVTDNTSLDICTFGNVFDSGIVGTLEEFENGFCELLESIRLLYRVGTNEVIKIRKKSVV